MKPFQTILHATDFSDSSQVALDMAGSLARDNNANLIVLHVVHTPILAAADQMLTAAAPIDLAPIEQKLSTVRPPQGNVNVVHRLVEGDVTTEILRAAVDSDADLIVLGSHGRTGVSRMLMGSVAEHVVRKATCTVVVARPPHHDVSSS